MGFISYSLSYYEKELKQLEHEAVTEASLYRAKQLLKILDDLVDEGYIELNERLEEKVQGVSRLRRFLKENEAEPFPMYRKEVPELRIFYGESELELAATMDELIERAGGCTGITYAKNSEKKSFLQELRRFCEWIGYENNTAYIFLFRDTLLPYVYYRGKRRNAIYPWLIGRKTLEQLTGKSNVDDEIRGAIIRALEKEKCSNFNEFCEAVLPKIRGTAHRYQELENCLKKLLAEIKEERIVVVESGCSGTFPMLLKSLDERVDVRMYTTYPYLLEAYGNRIFTPKYEENRLFETMYSQDVYFQFFDLRNGQFYVKKCENADIEKKALEEIRAMLK